jgi:osmoprotectant transport system permease protein
MSAALWRLPARPAFWLALLLAALVFGMPLAAPLFHAWFPALREPLYPRASFLQLTASHLAMVLASSLAAVAVGVGLGIAVTRPAGRDWRAPAEALAALGQTFPPVAVLALAVPALGYGAAPTVLALTLYGVLPVLGGTLAGLQDVPAAVREAADGMGYPPGRRLCEVELPLAAPLMMAGVRSSVIVNIGTAAIGATVGAVGLGSPIVEGLSGGNPAYVIQGALVVGTLALLADSLLGELERWLRRGA